jgi:hypothetical protein
VSDKDLRHKWQKFVKRNWVEIRASWVGNMPTFPALGSPPDPGLDHLPTLLAVPLPDKDKSDRFQDVDGLRRNALWEAVFLFHKCSHTHLAAQRIGQQGMHSWSLFNAYHSAYLGARGLMALLGVPILLLGSGGQIAIDLFPEPIKKKGALPSPLFQEFLIVRLPTLDQRYLWEAFQRVLRMTTATCWDAKLRDDLLDLDFKDFSRPRNKYLYNAAFWPPRGDLLSDLLLADFNTSFGATLVIADEGFLLRLCFSVYRLFEQLMTDLASQSAIIKAEVDASRIVVNADLPAIECYTNFLSQVGAA